MSEAFHLLVTSGNDDGCRLAIPPAGARLGRSSKNDFVISDPLLSRHHCRLYFKPGDGLWVTDLASANQTFVNGAAIQDTRVRVGDVVSVGNTAMQVVSDQISVVPAPVADGGEPVVDLGLSGPQEKSVTRTGHGIGRFPLVVIASLVVALAIAAWIPKLLKRPPPAPEPPPITATNDETDLALLIEYEKVQASADNIFRYHLRVSPNRTISIQIDDIENKIHLRKETRVPQDDVDELARDILKSGFFKLTGEYRGIQPDILESLDMAIVVGKKAHHTRIVNRLEPDAFTPVREMVEEFGVDWLKLHAIPRTPEELRKMARESYELGRKLHDEREVKFGNLALAIKRFEEAEWYLESLEPKPDYYPEIIASQAGCKRELQAKYDDRIFRAERAIRLRDWEEAAVELNIIREMVPDRADPRHESARRKLIDVEKRMRELAR